MKKITNYGWIALISIAILLALFLGLYSNSSKSNGSKKNIESIASQRNYEEEFQCNEDANVWQTECLIEQLDRASALREWKQKKLETLKHPEINLNNLIGGELRLQEEQKGIKKWRENFEETRDVWCEASNAFLLGMSGIPGVITECKLNYEIMAIKNLDDIYYNNILKVKDTFDNKGVADFEPKEQDVEELVKTNNTDREKMCVWAGEKACE